MEFSEQHKNESLQRLRRLLKASGVTDEEFQKALDQEALDLLVIDKLIVNTRHYFTEDELIDITGANPDLVKRLWRALGFPEANPKDPIFTDFDIEALTTILSVIKLGIADPERAIQLTRVIGSSLARIAEAQVTMAQLVEGADDPIIRAETLALAVESLLPSLVRILEYAFRRHLQAAARRAWLYSTRTQGGSLQLTVGFADMVGFTYLSQQVNPDTLADIVGRFESLAYDIIIKGSGRVVKMIGDEVMFVVDDPAQAVEIGLELASAYSDDELLSDVRIALAYGEVLAWEGDYFGAVVNKASRIVNIANPGSVLVPREIYELLKDDQRFVFKQIRPAYLKDIGRVELWLVTRPGEEAKEDFRRIGARWRRFSEILRDLDELREQGQRLIDAVVGQQERDDLKRTKS
jgi:adenylate cyclase